MEKKERIRVAIHGAAGRMGRRLVSLAAADPELALVAALEAPDHPDLGRDAGELVGLGKIDVPLTAALNVEADCLIVFSTPSATPSLANMCRQRHLPVVLATTGLNELEKEHVIKLSQEVPVVWSPNMSLAVNLTMRLATIAAEALKDCPNGADVEIIERHHRFKEDAPSGTALRFGEIIASVMGQTSHQFGRHGLVGRRPHREIGYHSLRVGDDPGAHTIVFGMLGETIELTVRATNRDCYALGALEAAKFVVDQPPGLYGMYDVLNLAPATRNDQAG